ncbi:mannitol 2-dehydrogenase [Cohaesibacter sp. ES.047]|uniref:mannitol dehydrogenase family protein n=1 Tax=Cohaesibacter sp. ES.047 TaxID=1798205 RepID=UPI000BB7F180|nr:mannitol dehydrogenase family protein [Cohaesibacter sp. ES.047]SNY92223.1 mannitol 2-dehydrogenase [Cohaesibacter sp. ES.047]
MTTALNRKALQSLSGIQSVPSYDRSGITPGILHVGVGNFHRAHMAVYLNDLMNRGLGFDWGIVGAGMRPSDETMRQALQAQDWLTTVVELDPNGLSASVTGAMIDFLPIDPDTLLAGMVDPRIRILSMTITEGGYYIDAASGRLDIAHPDIQADANNPDSPKTLFGIILRALQSRKESGVPPFTILSCDNLPENGQVAKQTLVGLARLSNPEFADWIDANVSFPNCMVDRITPATTERERAIVEETFGVKDAAPVVCEPFRQWVIEDKFPQGRPPLEAVGCEFVKDVRAHELMKLRILNAGHASVCYAAALMGYHFVHDAMADQDICNWLQAVQTREAIPTLKPLSGVDYAAYLATVIARFSNREMGDTIPRNVADGSDRQPKFILPALRDALEMGHSVEGFALEVALWCRYCTGVMEDGSAVQIVDPMAETLVRLSNMAIDQPRAFLENEAVFGDLARNVSFADAFGKWLTLLHSQGVRAALKAYVAKQ